jgi:hypothetical protein
MVLIDLIVNGKLVLRKTILRNMIDRVWAALDRAASVEVETMPFGDFKKCHAELPNRGG